jgi:GH15 family glucan-1,4-alpha-glucosidase
MSLADLGLIGNCQLAAHVRRDGAIVWSCMPRFDSAPIFGALLDDDGGQFTIGPAVPGLGVQRYLPNTNVLETRFEAPEGAFRVLDFAPRFVQWDRSFRPTKLVRIVEPLAGTPRIRVSCDPVLGWSKARPQREAGSHHISYRGFPAEVRLTTNAPLSYLDGSRSRSPSASTSSSPGARRSRKRWSRCASASSARPSPTGRCG